MNIKWNMDCATVELCSSFMMQRHSHTLLLGFMPCPRALPHMRVGAGIRIADPSFSERPALQNWSDWSFFSLWIWIESSCRRRDAYILCGYFKQLQNIWSISDGMLIFYSFSFFQIVISVFSSEQIKKNTLDGQVCYWPESIIFF